MFKQTQKSNTKVKDDLGFNALRNNIRPREREYTSRPGKNRSFSYELRVKYQEGGKKAAARRSESLPNALGQTSGEEETALGSTWFVRLVLVVVHRGWLVEN